MGKLFAYARVSTPRQGERGVSLPEQRDAIERYATVHGFEIARWFEERESASQQGRPAFNEMLSELRRGVAPGVIIHKIDRSARNYDDWADISRLVDAGVDVHFATENIDLKTVGGRLSADIQAAVAVHYSRNLREEVKKGLYGRLKQGVYPFRAPIGYLDQGSAKLKIPDPVTGPLVRRAFELYASGQFSLPSLAKEMARLGLRNRGAGHVTVNGFATLLKNPFYMGIMRIEKTNQSFAGNHEPLVSTDLFLKVQELLAGKRVDRKERHVFRYSRFAKCRTCGYSLIAEPHKAYVYYRCHNRPFKNPPVCPPTSVREEHIDDAIVAAIAHIDLSEQEIAFAYAFLSEKRSELERNRASVLQPIRLQRDHVDTKLARLTDLLVEGTLDKTIFSEKQNDLLTERARIQERLAAAEANSGGSWKSIEKTVELAKNPSVLYKLASPENKRHLAKVLLSNVTVSEKIVDVTLALPFRLIAERQKSVECRPYRGSCRTWEEILNELITKNLRVDLQ